jgi:heme exporter protein C
MKTWLKLLAIVILVCVHLVGMLGEVPRLPILNETIRALYFHVPMWFGMLLLFSVSVFYAVRYLRNPTLENDLKSVEFANIGLVFGILGMLTGMLWAKFAWGSETNECSDCAVDLPGVLCASGIH